MQKPGDIFVGPYLKSFYLFSRLRYFDGCPCPCLSLNYYLSQSQMSRALILLVSCAVCNIYIYYIKSGAEENVFHRSKCLKTTNTFEGKIFYDDGKGTKGKKA